MAGVKLNEITKLVQKFRLMQKQAGVNDPCNVVNMKWTMRDIVIDMDNNMKRMEVLLSFFFMVSETKTWDDFVYNYESYWTAFVDWRMDRDHMAQLQRETLERTKNKNESRS